jgi:hypothetical protein
MSFPLPVALDKYVSTHVMSNLYWEQHNLLLCKRILAGHSYRAV